MPKPAMSARPATATRPHPGAVIRPASASDLEAIECIEREQFSNPWTREYYAAELRNSLCHFFVAMSPPGGRGGGAALPPAGAHAGAITGYLLFWRLGSELELHKIAVAKAWQRQGHATQLMEFFIRTGRGWGCERAVLEVRASNEPAIRLYEKFGFQLAGRRKEYYTSPCEDALVFELTF